jgi:hypothetical protein
MSIQNVFLEKIDAKRSAAAKLAWEKRRQGSSQQPVDDQEKDALGRDKKQREKDVKWLSRLKDSELRRRIGIVRSQYDRANEYDKKNGTQTAGRVSRMEQDIMDAIGIRVHGGKAFKSLLRNNVLSLVKGKHVHDYHSPKMLRCLADLKAKGHDDESAHRICYSSIGEDANTTPDPNIKTEADFKRATRSALKKSVLDIING